MAQTQNHSLLLSKFPVLLPYCRELFLSNSEFETQLATIANPVGKKDILDGLGKNDSENSDDSKNKEAGTSSPFIDALQSTIVRPDSNLTFTNNGDLALSSSGSSVVDLFYDLRGNHVSEKLLERAYHGDPNATVKIIFNCRSIHLGKGEQSSFYHAFAWLYQNHPETFLQNLPWLVRPIIEKPKKQKDTELKDDDSSTLHEKQKHQHAIDKDDEFEFVIPNDLTFGSVGSDYRHGLAHGYWKDLLNLLTLAANDKLQVDATFRGIITSPGVKAPSPRSKSWKENKTKRNSDLQKQYENVKTKLKNDPKYRLFHIAVARLFADQLRRDLDVLEQENKSRDISFAAKWAPSLKEAYDKQTFITSTISELMFSHATICPQVDKEDRELYLKHARIEYRFKVLSPLRKYLDIVERHITDKSYDQIRYERLPSKALNRYKNIFASKDNENFTRYVDKVASGKASISGAVLLPSGLVMEAMKLNKPVYNSIVPRHVAMTKDMKLKLLNGQWNSIVERIKRSGKLESSIAVCDVSGSMTWPKQRDGTIPIHSAIGLSILVSEVTKPPFDNCFISFTSAPSFISLTHNKAGQKSTTLLDKVEIVQKSPIGYDTNFVSVFEHLILPLARKHKLKQEDMVKQVFVFSDMQFNAATVHGPTWGSSYDRIKNLYESYGYEMPQMVFWNLGEKVPNVPVSSTEPGTILVSGNSQGQMKMFLDAGGFDVPEDEYKTEILMKDNPKDGDVVIVEKEKSGINSLKAVQKAISHPAYRMIKAYD